MHSIFVQHFSIFFPLKRFFPGKCLFCLWNCFLCHDYNCIGPCEACKYVLSMIRTGFLHGESFQDTVICFSGYVGEEDRR